MSIAKVITYSPAQTIVPTYECFNLCSYCNFRADPGQSSWLSLKQAQNELKLLDVADVCEILILSGEVHPRSPSRKSWFKLIYDLCQLALNLGFLPHTNAGILHFAEMQMLKEVNVSMGLMLEQVTPRLLKTVHRNAPSKDPHLRMQQLEWAGQLKIPFTTGLLLGIGETVDERIETLEAIANIQERWGNIQEVILQPHSPGSKQTFNAVGFNPQELPELIALAREILPDTIAIQIPPNLIPEANFLLECIDAGARDLGGIVPKDEVNPDYAHLDLLSLKKILTSAGWHLVPRLPVYPQYYNYLSSQLQTAIAPRLEQNSKSKLT